MKQLLQISIFLLSSISILFAGEIIVGASAVPHSEILEFAKPILKKQGVDLKIVIFNDYILPNKALESKDLDANFFQHIVYLDAQNKEFKYNFVNIGAIHIEPMGIYSSSIKSLKNLAEGAKVIFSNSVADRGRALMLLQNAGLIKLQDGVDPINADFKDIISNPKKLVFTNDVDPAMLPKIYANNEADLILINTNYALSANLNPSKDALFIEGASSPYANIVVARQDNRNNPDLVKLIEVLKSLEVKKFEEDKYKGAIIPLQ